MAPCGREAHQLALCAGLPRMEYEWLHDGQSGTPVAVCCRRMLVGSWRVAVFFAGIPRSRRCAIGIVLEVFLWNIHSALLLLMWGGTKIACVPMRYETPMSPSFFRSVRFHQMRSRVGRPCCSFSTLLMTCVLRLFLSWRNHRGRWRCDGWSLT